MADWDVKLTLQGTTHKLRLLNTEQGKAWKVAEPPVGDTEAGFKMDDWTFGVGLNRFSRINQAGHLLRLSDGFGVDLTEPGKIKHGPGSSTVGTLAGTPKAMILFLNKVWILTSTHLYNYDGTTFVDFWGPAASGATHQTNTSTTLNAIEKFGTKLYIADGSNIYRTNGTTDPDATKSTDNADFLLALQTPTGPQLWRTSDTNLLAGTLNPDLASPTWTTATTVGEGDAVTNIFSISGLLFVTTQSTIYAINADQEAIEMDKKLRTRRSASAFSIKSESGSDVWFSDGKDVIRMVNVGFEEFDIRSGGPFRSHENVPFSEVILKGTITSISQDIDHVYVTVERGSDVYVYKGFEIGRGIFTWSPLIKVASTTNDIAGVFKLTGDAEPKLYINTGTSLVSYVINEWTVFNTAWEVVTPRFSTDDETVNKIWHKLLTYLEQADAATNVQAYYRLDANTAWTVIGAVMTGDGLTERNPGILAGRRVQLRFVASSSNSAKSVNLRSFELQGIKRPLLARLFDFTVIADTKTEADFLYSLRTATTAFILITDRFGTERSAFVHPQYPQEIEPVDEILHVPVRAYHIIAEEVPSAV